MKEQKQNLKKGINSEKKFSFKHKCTEWIKRYWLPETIGTVFAYLGYFIIYKLTNSEIAAAFGGTWGENLGFYGTVITREIIQDKKWLNENGEKYNLKAITKTFAKLASEFGPAEYLDSFVIRPLTIGLGAKYLGQTVGILAGKLTADILFYISAIISYELRKKLFSNKKEKVI